MQNKKKIVQFQRFLHECETRSPNEEVLGFMSPGLKLDSTNWMWCRMPTVLAAACGCSKQSDRKEQDGAREGRGDEVTHCGDLWISNPLSYLPLNCNYLVFCSIIRFCGSSCLVGQRPVGLKSYLIKVFIPYKFT